MGNSKTGRAIGVIFAATLLVGCEQIQTKISPQPSQSKTVKVAASAETPVKDIKPLGYLLDVNEATAAQLKHVPGMTPEIERLILNTRPFLDMVEFDDELDLLEVSEKQREALYEHIFMVIDINNGMPEDLAFVPQLSNSVAHQIKTGRPYAKRAELKSILTKSRHKDEAEKMMSYFKVVKAKR